MADRSVFVGAALRQGFSAEAAEAALAAVEGRLAEGGIAARRLFCFRTAGPPTGAAGAGGGDPAARPRLLLAFADPDDALGFTQRRGLGASPRLTALTLGQALATLLERPAIGALLVAGGDEPPDARAAAQGLPGGVRVERAELLALLAGR
jgi:hypothetical protein